jgi:superfamily I DNA/RNA helicase
MYDAIVLDETQDYLPEEVDIFFRLGQVVFAGADSRQHIYVTGPTCYSDLVKRFGGNVFSLKYHYRNGTKICQVADELAKVWGDREPLLPTSNYDERRYPSSVEIRCYPDMAGQVRAAVNPLTLQMKAYPKEYLGLLCPSRSILRAVWQELETYPIRTQAVLQSAEDGYVQFEEEKPICVCTIHGAKGLEFRTVHLFDTESIKKSPLNRNIAYTAVTRAKTSLTIYHSKALPPYIDSALNVVRAPVQPARLDQLFGGS